MTIDAGVNLDLTGSSFTAVTTATITGAAAVTLDEDGGGASLVTINASGSTGGVTATAQTGCGHDLHRWFGGRLCQAGRLD